MDIRREVLRNVVLCQSLPLGIRPAHSAGASGAATPAEKVEHFIVAGVNSSWPFYDLADRVLEVGHQPDCIFDIAYEAQNASLRNRAGDKVNYAPIYLLVPVITAQILQYLECGTREDVDAILARTGDVLRATTEADVEFLERFIHLGYEISARHGERIGRPKPPRYPVLQGKYENVWEVVRDYQQIHTVREMLEGYPRSQQVYRFLLHNQETGIVPATELIYNLLLPQVGRPDATIDIIVVGLYLLLIKHPESLLFV
jgi:hypothetical protein